MSSGGWNISAVMASAFLGVSAIAAPIAPIEPVGSVATESTPVSIPFPLDPSPASPPETTPAEADLALPPMPVAESLAIPPAETVGPITEGGRVVLALAAVLVLALGARAVARRTVPSLGRSAGVLEVLARHPLGRGHALLVLRMFRRIVLVHHAGSTVTPLSEITDEAEVAAVLRALAAEVPSNESAGAESFADVMRRVAASASGGADADTDVESDDAVEIVDLTRTQAGRGSRGARGARGGRGGRRGWWGRTR